MRIMVTAEGKAVRPMVRDETPHCAVQGKTPIENRVTYREMFLHSLHKRRKFLRDLGILAIGGAMLGIGYMETEKPGAAAFASKPIVSLGTEINSILKPEFVGWSGEESKLLEKVFPKSRQTVEEIFGPPMPWVAGRHLVILKGGGKEQNGHTAEFYKSGEDLVIAFYVKINPPMDENVLIAVLGHELKHAWFLDQPIKCPDGLVVEGLARMVEISYITTGDPGVQRRWEDYWGYRLSSYQSLNATRTFRRPHFCSGDLKDLAQLHAGYAWYVLGQEHPSFFKAWADSHRIFPSKPSTARQLELARDVFPAFREWTGKHSVFDQ